MSGCVTNLPGPDGRLTIWKMTSGSYELMNYGAGGKVLPLTYDPLFQAIADEMHRLACEVGRLRRAEIDRQRKAGKEG